MMENHAIIHIAHIITHTIPLLDTPVEGVKIIDRKPLARLIAERKATAGRFGVASPGPP